MLAFSPARLATQRALEVPWGRVSILTTIWAVKRDRLVYLERSLFVVAEKH
jgi:hypothetical protein